MFWWILIGGTAVAGIPATLLLINRLLAVAGILMILIIACTLAFFSDIYNTAACQIGSAKACSEITAFLPTLPGNTMTLGDRVRAQNAADHEQNRLEAIKENARMQEHWRQQREAGQ